MSYQPSTLTPGLNLALIEMAADYQAAGEPRLRLTPLLEGVPVTCAEDNPASIRVIEKNHDRLLNKVVSSVSGRQVRRCWSRLPLHL